MSAPNCLGLTHDGKDAARVSHRWATSAFAWRFAAHCRRAGVWALAVGVALALTAAARAEDQGQADLDRATEIKLTAKSFEELDEVVRLCRKALDGGLDKEQGKFALELLAGTLSQRAEIIGAEIFDSPIPPARWPEFRRLAVGDLEESLKLEPDQPDSHMLLGRLYALPGGDKMRAIAAFNEVISLTADQPGRQAKALLMRANLRAEPEQRLEDYNQAIQLAPRNADAMRARGLYYLQASRYEEAVTDLQKAIELDPKSAETYEAKGVALFLLKRYDDALVCLDGAIERYPESAQLFANRARIFAIQGNNEKALADLDKALQMEPRSVQFMLLRARVYQSAHDSERALDDVNEVLRMRPGFPEALQLHAYLSAGSGKFDEAIGDLEELKNIAPDNAELLLQLGMFYVADKRTQQGIDIFSQILSEDSHNWLAHRARGDAYLNLGKQAEALADYEAALESEPENSGILNNLAWLLSTSPDDKLRDGKRAVELATMACKLTKYEEAHILSTLAACYAEIGDFTAAMHWSEEAVAVGRASQKEQLAKELQSYHDKKPWREEIPPDLGFDERDELEVASRPDAPSDKPVIDADDTLDTDAADPDAAAPEKPAAADDDAGDASSKSDEAPESPAASGDKPTVKAPQADE